MPFTSFHFGPGAALKAVVPAHFSFMVFCYSQVVTDLETASYLFRGECPVHILRAWRSWFPASLTRLFGPTASIPWRLAFVSAFVGTYSHVFLDSIMHQDILPLSPVATTNPMLHNISLPLLHLLCLVLGLAGVLILPFRVIRNDRPGLK